MTNRATLPVLVGILGFFCGYFVRNAAWQTRAEKCEANFRTETILYEPGAPPTLTLFNGLVNVQPAGMAGPVGPRWIVPAKIQPQAAPGSAGFIFAYFDPASRKLDGPYLPKIVPADQ